LAPQEIAEAQAWLEEAIRLDPDFAQAWAGLAVARVFAGLCANERPSEFWPKIRDAASRALELNPRCSEAHTALGVLKMFYEWDPKGAEEEFDRARHLDPDDAFPLSWKAILLAFIGRHTEALATARHGVAMEPLWALAHLTLGEVLIYGDRPEEGAAVLEAALRVWPRSPQLHWWLALAYLNVAQLERALAHYDVAADLAGHLPYFEALRGVTMARLGRTNEARAVLADLKARSNSEYVDPYAVFSITLGLDGIDAAAPYLEDMLATRSFTLPYFLPSPRLRSLRADPRFRAVLEKVFPGVVFEA
jgi:serine/threonine-protein kinase